MRKLARWRSRTPHALPVTPIFDEVGLEASAYRSCLSIPFFGWRDALIPAIRPQPEEAGGSPVAGLRCSSPLGTIAEALTGSDPRTVRCTPSAQERQVAVFSDVNGLVLSERFLPAGELAWGAPLSDQFPGALTEYVADYEAGLAPLRCESATLLAARPMDELRAMAAGYEEARRVRSKVALAELLAARQHVTEPDVWPAWYRGGRLVLRADSGPAAAILERLRAAARDGALGVSNHYFAPSRALFLFDTRDESPELAAERVDHFDWIDARMAELAPIAAELKRRGWSFYALGSPALDAKGNVTYHVNGARSPRTENAQPFGRYRLDELLEEKFASDALARAAEKRAEQAAHR